MLVMMLSSHAGDDAAAATWPQHNVLLSHAGASDGATERLGCSTM
jgi:hypothetical protein